MSVMDTKKSQTNAADAELFKRVMKRTERYTTLAAARSAASHGVKPLRVMLGDDERFWVVTPADAQRLERMGYEYAV